MSPGAQSSDLWWSFMKLLLEQIQQSQEIRSHSLLSLTSRMCIYSISSPNFCLSMFKEQFACWPQVLSELLIFGCSLEQVRCIHANPYAKNEKTTNTSKSSALAACISPCHSRKGTNTFSAMDSEVGAEQLLWSMGVGSKLPEWLKDSRTRGQ